MCARARVCMPVRVCVLVCLHRVRVVTVRGGARHVQELGFVLGSVGHLVGSPSLAAGVGGSEQEPLGPGDWRARRMEGRGDDTCSGSDN